MRTGLVRHILSSGNSDEKSLPISWRGAAGLHSLLARQDYLPGGKCCCHTLASAAQFTFAVNTSLTESPLRHTLLRARRPGCHGLGTAPLSASARARLGTPSPRSCGTGVVAARWRRSRPSPCSGKTKQTQPRGRWPPVFYSSRAAAGSRGGSPWQGGSSMQPPEAGPGLGHPAALHPCALHRSPRPILPRVGGLWPCRICPPRGGRLSALCCEAGLLRRAPCSSEPAPLRAGTAVAQHPWLSHSLGTRAPSAPPGEPVPPACSCKELAESCNMCAEQLTEGSYLANEEVKRAALGFCNPSVAPVSPACAR